MFYYKFFTITETIERTSPANKEQRECGERWIEKPAETNSLRRFRSYPTNVKHPRGFFSATRYDRLPVYADLLDKR